MIASQFHTSQVAISVMVSSVMRNGERIAINGDYSCVVILPRVNSMRHSAQNYATGYNLDPSKLVSHPIGLTKQLPLPIYHMNSGLPSKQLLNTDIIRHYVTYRSLILLQHWISHC